jgi:hypothetical protein
MNTVMLPLERVSYSSGMSPGSSIRRLRRNRYAAAWVAHLIVWGSIASAGALVFAFAPQASKTEAPQGPEIPVTRIQLFPDRDNLCPTLFFHNDSGHYQDGGRRQCTIPRDMLMWTVRSRTEAFAEAFRSSW